MSSRVLIVGGVAGGASCAARLRRLDESVDIILCERGPHVSFANCGLPYFIGEVISEEDQLFVTTPAALKADFRLDVRIRSEVTAIDRSARQVQIRDLESGRSYAESYDHLVLAPGAAPLVPPLPGIDLPGIFTIRTVPDSQAVKRWVADHQARSAVVVGGGFIGIEMAENLRHLGLDVALVEMAPQLMPPLDPEMAWPLQEHLDQHGIALHLGTAVQGFARHDEGLLVRTDGPQLQADMVILAIGVRPESELARAAGLELNRRGAIVVDEQMRSSDPAIFAVGDAVEVRNSIIDVATLLPLAGPANRQGRVAAEVIAGRDSRFRGVQGTSVLGAFGMTVACTGLSEKALKSHGIADYELVRLHRGDHVDYYPGSSLISLKLLHRRSDGRLLGAQAVGLGGVDKRIDVIAMAIQMGATISDLAEAELCYAPAYGAAKDPVNIAGMIAENARNGDVRFAHWEALPAEAFLLDVRPAPVFAKGHSPSAINIPLGELRRRSGELPADRPIHLTCNVGQKAYVASRLLSQLGFDCQVMAGGETSHRAIEAAS